jgi:hypothetical protein
MFTPRSALLRFTFWLAGALLVFGSVPAGAQTQAINGSIRGRVTDAAGAPVPQAKVTILNDANGFARTSSTEDDGYYVFPNLPLGTYAVTILKEGFQTERHTNVALSAGVEAVVDGQLKVGAVTTEIEVTGGAAMVEPPLAWPRSTTCL